MPKPQNNTQFIEKIQYSFVPNHREMMQALARAKFSNREFRLIIALLNQTNGYLREEDELSSSFWQALTFMSRQSVHATLKRLVALGVFTKNEHKYKVNHPNSWPIEAFNLQPLARRSITISNSLLKKEGQQANYRWLAEILKSSQNKDAANIVSPVRHTVSTLRRLPSHQCDDLKLPKESVTKESTKDITALDKSSAARKKQAPDPKIAEIFTEIRAFLGYPDKTQYDPIPNYGKEGQAIKRMLARRFTVSEILDCWKNKVSRCGREFVSMTWVNEDIGRKHGKLPKPGQGASGGSKFEGWKKFAGKPKDYGDIPHGEKDAASDAGVGEEPPLSQQS